MEKFLFLNKTYKTLTIDNYRGKMDKLIYIKNSEILIVRDTIKMVKSKGTEWVKIIVTIEKGFVFGT